MPAVEAQPRAGAEHGGGAFVVAAVVTASECVDAVLPGGGFHALWGAQAGGEQFAGGGDGYLGADSGAE